MPKLKTLEDISPKAWEHPQDTFSRNALEQIPGWTDTARWLLSKYSEPNMKKRIEASSELVTAKSHPQLHRIYEETLGVLHSPDEWPLYVSPGKSINAAACGADDPFLMITSAALNTMREGELRVVLGHEISHILSEHVLYKHLLRLLITFGGVAAITPMTSLAHTAIQTALLEWDRKSELSADRAGLLAAQNIEDVQRTLITLFKKDPNAMSVEEFREYAQEKKTPKDMKEYFWRVISFLGSSHPELHTRSIEIDRWFNEGDYHPILHGTYSRRSFGEGRPLTQSQYDILNNTRAEMQELSMDGEDDFEMTEGLGKDMQDEDYRTWKSTFRDAKEDVGEQVSKTLFDLRQRWRKITRD